jgi:2-oxoisovalerate dehydrogenase E1 component alpha subunit
MAKEKDIAAEFRIAYRRYLDPSGKLVGEAPPFARDRDVMIALYRNMVLTRIFDAKAIAMQRTGQIGTYPSCAGEEAVGTGYASAMKPEDVMAITYREQAAQIWRGVKLDELLLYWGGDERGCDYSGPREDFPIAVPIATQAPHAAGIAAAFKLRKEPRVAVATIGDGGTSKGDFYEALNLAGAWKLPLIIVVINNGWAISVPLSKQTATETLAQKAIAGGLPGIQVDGNDVIAVRQVMSEAVERARSGDGATLIEAVTYRMGDHTTADDASRYRRAEDVSAAWKLDPNVRLRTYLAEMGWWSKDNEESLIAECRDILDQAIARYLAVPPPKPETMFDYLFETLPSSLAWQRKKLAEG